MSSFKAQAEYYRNRGMSYIEDIRKGTISPESGREALRHDLAWAEYYTMRSQGRHVPEPVMEPEEALPVATIIEGVECYECKGEGAVSLYEICSHCGGEGKCFEPDCCD